MIVDEILFDKNHLTITHKADEKLIHTQWKGFATSEQFREGFNLALQIIEENEIENWLGNLKMMELIFAQDEDWASTVWFPLLAKTNLKKLAIVTSLDFLNNAAMRRIVNSASGITGFETRFFVDSADAHFWLTNS